MVGRSAEPAEGQCGCMRAWQPALFCSRYVWIWLLRLVPNVGSFTGMSTFSLLLASTMLFKPLSSVPTSSAVNSANSWKPVARIRYSADRSSCGARGGGMRGCEGV